MNLCECNCGDEVAREGNRFIRGHNPSWMTGRFHSDKTKEKISIAKIGVKQTKEHTMAIMKSRKGYSPSEETRLKMSQVRLGIVFSDEHRQKLSDAHMGVPLSEEHAKAIVKAREGYKHSEETKLKMSVTSSLQMTDDIRQQMSEAACDRIKKNPKIIRGYGKQGHFFSNKNNKKLHYRSSYELQAYNILEQMSVVKSYKVEPFRVPYEWEGHPHNTIPDLLITYTSGVQELIEVKPTYRLKESQTKAKLDAMADYAFDNDMNFSIWSEGMLFEEVGMEE